MENIIVIGKMIEGGIKEKNLYLPILANADEEIHKFTSNMGFVYEEPVQLFYQSTDERLSASINKKERVLTQPEIAIQECVKNKLDILNDFVKRYHIGFIRSAQLNENGFVEVKFHCLIHSNCVTDNRKSAEDTFNAQIAFLREIGLEIEKVKYYGLRICRTEKNLQIIEKLFKDRNCSRVKFIITDNFIDEIHCIFNINEIDKFKEVPFDIVHETNEVFLNDDEIGKISKYVKEILHAKSSIFELGDDIKNTCCSLIESYFSDICKVFNYNGIIMEKVKNRYEEERCKNIEISNIENDMSNAVPVDKFKDILNSYKRKLDKFLIENLSFHISDFSVDKYGFVCCNLRFICHDWTNEYKLPTEEFLRENFKMSLGNQEDETLAMLDTYENKEKILLMIKQFCSSSRIIETKSKVTNGAFVINEVKIIIDNIADII